MQSQQLREVRSYGPDDAQNEQLVRTYTLSYDQSFVFNSGSGSGATRLKFITECAGTTCYRPTIFTWSTAQNTFSTQETTPTFDSERLSLSRFGDVGDGRQDLVWLKARLPLNSNPFIRSYDLFVSFGDRTASAATLTTPAQTAVFVNHYLRDSDLQLADLDGDGREDVVFLESAIGNDVWRAFRSLGRPTAGEAVFGNTNILNFPMTAFDKPTFADINGDGLLDVIYSRFETSPTTDPNFSTKARLQRFADSPARFEYGDEITLTGAWQPEIVAECGITPKGYRRVCGYGPLGTDGYLGPDLTGDGRGDLLLRLDVTDILEDKVCSNSPQPPQCEPILIASFTTLFATGNVNFATATVTLDRIWDSQNGPFRSPEGNISIGNSQLADLNADGLLDLIDFGEGATNFDTPLQYRINTGAGFTTPYLNAFPPQTNVRGNSFVDVDGDGRADLVAASTTTGVLQKSSFTRPGEPFTSYSALAGGNAKLCGTASCTNAGVQSQYSKLFSDIDGDGSLDFISLRVAGGSGLYVSRAPATSRYRARDVIEGITNGYGALTTLNYQPLTNKAIYQRDFNSRLDADRLGGAGGSNPERRFLGRGSPVIDLLAPIYVIARADSSAPRFGAVNAISRTRYRYTGLKIQSGGRGMLGFRTITSLDDNAALSDPSSPSFISTVTINRQDFPYIGAPIATIKSLVQGSFSYAPGNPSNDLDACAVNMEAVGKDCFYRPPADVNGSMAEPTVAAHPAVGGVAVSTPAQSWACFGSGGATVCEPANPATQSNCLLDTPTLNPGIFAGVQARLISPQGGEIDSGNFVPTSAQQPIFAFISGTNEPMRDPADGSLSLDQYSAFCYDSFGNNTQNVVDTYSPSDSVLFERKETNNSYSNFSGNAGGTFRWRLGRMTASSVTHMREDPNALGTYVSDTRNVNFTYDIGSITSTTQTNSGFLKSERSQSVALDATEDLRTQQFRDEFGNIIVKMSCSRGVPVADCDDPTDITKVLQRPTREGKPLDWVHRYAVTKYDTRLAAFLRRGRFADEDSVPFFDGTSTGASIFETTRAKVLSRNVFGDPTQTQDLNGVDQVMLYGALGRAYYQWSETVAGSTLNSGGVSSTTILRWCGSGINEVSCPSGSVFRQAAVSSLGQASYSYFDVLGRETLTVARSFNDPTDAAIGGNAAFNAKQFVASCKYFEAHGRNARASEPFFLSDVPTTPGEPRFTGDPCAAGRDWTITTYDGLGREQQTSYPDGGAKSLLYGKENGASANPLTTVTKITQSAGVILSTTITKNVLGEIIETIDDAGLSTKFEYDLNGNQVAIRRKAAASQADIVSAMFYDRSGRKTSETDPDSGNSTNRYNALGEVIRVTDAKGQISENHYDALGRIWQRVATGAGVSVQETSTFNVNGHQFGAVLSGEYTSASITLTEGINSGQPLKHGMIKIIPSTNDLIRAVQENNVVVVGRRTASGGHTVVITGVEYRPGGTYKTQANWFYYDHRVFLERVWFLDPATTIEIPRQMNGDDFLASVAFAFYIQKPR